MLFIRWLSYIVEIKRKNVIYNTNLIFLFFSFRLFLSKIFRKKIRRKTKKNFKETELKKVKKVFLFSPNSLFTQIPEETQKRCHYFMNITKSKRWMNTLQNAAHRLSVKRSKGRISRAEPTFASKCYKNVVNEEI